VKHPTIASLKTVERFRGRLAELQLDLPVDDEILSAPASPLSQPMRIGPVTVGNRFCIHPMEGWDGTADGRPTELTFRRWRHFGVSGAKLIWGGEAVAVQHDGRANPNQLLCRPENESSLAALLVELLDAHRSRFGDTADLLVGLQLTHSGRYSKPNDTKRLEPRLAYRHPLLDKRCGIGPGDAPAVMTDDDLRRLIVKFVDAAKMAQRIGFHFVDVKHCHGYLGHELLSAFDRPGDFGGSFENRTRFLREIVAGIRGECPGLMIGVRLSAFDMPPFVQAESGVGEPTPVPAGPYPGFGCDRHDPCKIDLSETVRLLRLMRDELAIDLVNLTAGSPYYNPHIQRPALFPPSDGYQPPEDPLVGCARQIDVVRQLRAEVPGLPLVGTAYTYFQEYLPHVAQAVVRGGWVDFVGLGRMVLSYPELPADVLQQGRLDRRRLCRTFSDCTTAPRAGLVSGCYPLDPHYQNLPEYRQLKASKSYQA
jgi:2,4-dienoyl-CoA reductase-like NADH-dependent reductase (Old Yellow Enzyme family)